MLWKVHSSSEECLIQSLIKCLGDTKALTDRLHFRSEGNLSSTKLLKGEYRHLDCKIACIRCKTRLKAKITDLCSKDYAGCQINDRNTGNLADIWYGSAGTRIYLDHINLILIYDKLNIDQSDYMQGTCQLAGVIDQNSLDLL